MADFWSGLGSGVGGSLGALAGRGLGSVFGGTSKWQKKAAKDPIGHIVKSAKGAGIHPLFALGASANYSPTMTSGDMLQDQLAHIISGAGAQMGSSATGSRKKGGELEAAQVQALKASARRDDAAAAASLSEAKRTAAATRVGGRPDITGPGVKMEPVPVISHSKKTPHKTAAPMPAFQEVTTQAGGHKILVPSEGTGAEDNPELLIEAGKKNFARAYRAVQKKRGEQARKLEKKLKRFLTSKPIPFRDRR